VAASRTEGEETQRRASPEGRSRGGEGAPEGKSRGDEAAPEGRSLSGGAGLTQYAAAAQVPRDAAAGLAGMTHGMSIFHLPVMQQNYK